MSSFEQVKKADSSTNNWSGFVRHLDSIVYKSQLPTFADYLIDENSIEKEKLTTKPQVNNKLALGNLLKD